MEGSTELRKPLAPPPSVLVRSLAVGTGPDRAQGFVGPDRQALLLAGVAAAKAVVGEGASNP
jgi:hypothetical protein